jgi:hypothetical protein
MGLEGYPVDHDAIRPYPKNAPGDFYVENDCCITCEAPYHEAPELISHDEEGGGHCYFRRQPQTTEEIERAIRACWVSCVECLRYAGHDPEILKGFRAIGHAHLCDVLVGRRRTENVAGQDEGGDEPPRTPQPPQPDRFHPLWDRDLDG